MNANTMSENKIGAIKIPNRIVMSPMGRRRADADGTPNDMMADYYQQRASAGLIVTESTHPSLDGKAQPGSPHMIDQADLDGWTRVVDGVHAEGGRIVLQLMHAGSAAHPSVNGGSVPIAPSAIAPRSTGMAGGQLLDYPVPREMGQEDFKRVVAQFADGASLALRAGFDGVEVHGGNGYLIHQFLSTGVNQRADAYGGSPENRVRFAVEVLEAVAHVVGFDRLGLRLSPGASANQLVEENVLETYTELLNTSTLRSLAYVHTAPASDVRVLDWMRENWSGGWIHNMGSDLALTTDALNQRISDELAAGPSAVSIGRLFISNPDLLDRLDRGAELAKPDPKTFYGGGREGYTDYAPLVANGQTYA